VTKTFMEASELSVMTLGDINVARDGTECHRLRFRDGPLGT
jgi:hypothetical protein